MRQEDVRQEEKRFAGKVFCGGVFIGHVSASSLPALRRRASMLCNRHYKAVDELVLHRADGEERGEGNELTFTRVNRLSPDGRVSRGIWN